MFRLPTCPHCGTIYRYKDTFEIWKKDRRGIRAGRERECYHCKKAFRVAALPGMIPVGAVWAALSIGTNLLLLSRMKKLEWITMFIVTLGYMGLAFLVAPFFLQFKKVKEEKKAKRRV